MSSILTPECLACTACRLGRSGPRTQVVPTYSPDYEDVPVAFVGEAPGATEDATGIPFKGRSGRVLNGIIKYLGLRRSEVFIGNVVRCRPFQEEPYSNKPTKKQVAICYRKWLHPELVRVKPRCIVALGRYAADALHGDLWRLGALTTVLGGIPAQKSVTLVSLLHPAYWLRTKDPKFRWQVINLKRILKNWNEVIEKMELR